MRERHLPRRTGGEGIDAACQSMTHDARRHGRSRGRRGRDSDGGGDRRGGRRTRRGGGDPVVGGVASAVDDNGEDVGVAAGGTKQQPTP